MSSASDKPLAPEVPVALHVDGKLMAVLMCSPYDLDELAIGHLFSRGLIASPQDLKSLSICPDMRSVTISTMSGAGASLEPEGLVFSGCGAASVKIQPFADQSALKGPPESSVMFSIDELSAWAREMFASAELYRKTGGLHIAALASHTAAGRGSAPYFVAREDVGRHNAVDKVIGRGLLDGADFARAALLTSGRIAADMIQKAARAGVAVLVSRSIPTTEAYLRAVEAGVILVGRIGSAQPVIYTLADRVLY
ncbi:MAG: formate dehydrogenase accessory sulfurtransferase FdhD [Rectinemataceae bacterium]|nr:formate dehydrogenase accessory sulfurtransferase FdhD [Rectinemataceae bacterium]